MNEEERKAIWVAVEAYMACTYEVATHQSWDEMQRASRGFAQAQAEVMRLLGIDETDDGR